MCPFLCASDITLHHYLQEQETFYANEIEYHVTKSQALTNLDNVKFGTVFTDHMFSVQHIQGQGWSRPQIRPFGYLQLHPASQVLHYGMTCFEGMKAYRGIDDKIRLFRPESNMTRLLSSAHRLQLASFDPKELLSSIKSLIKTDLEWVPSKQGHSLYIRPFLFSSSHILGVAKATETSLHVIMSPVGPYFPSGMKPISLFIEENHSRAWPGGAGDKKIGGNYAPTIYPQTHASMVHGAQQVVYTYNPHASSVAIVQEEEGNGGQTKTSEYEREELEFEECGAMNIFFLLEKKDGKLELVTPSLRRGTILPGITRDSILHLARSWGIFQVSERFLTLGEVKHAVQEGRLREVFGTGTACTIQPIHVLLRSNGDMWHPKVVDAQDPDAIAPRLQHQLVGIQYGREEDRFGWMDPLDDMRIEYN